MRRLILLAGAVVCVSAAAFTANASASRVQQLPYCVAGQTIYVGSYSEDLGFLNSAVENGGYWGDPATGAPDADGDPFVAHDSDEATEEMDEGYVWISVAPGACPAAVNNDVDSVQVCESPGFSDNLVTMTVAAYSAVKGSVVKPVATPGYVPQGQNSGYADAKTHQLGLKCLGSPTAQTGVGVEVGSGAILRGPQYDPAFNPGTYGLATAAS